MLAQVVRQLTGWEIRSEGHGARVHDFLDGGRGVGAQRIGEDEAQHDSLLIDDDAQIPAARSHAFPQVAHALIDPTRRDITPRRIRHARRAGFAALTG